jgi:tetratricopeptide (TPR) repeat protein
MSNDVMRPNHGWFRRSTKAQEPYDKANEQGILLAKEARRQRDQSEFIKAEATMRKACSHLRQAIDLDPTQPEAVFNLGVMCLELGILVRGRLDLDECATFFDEAESRFEQVSKMAPDLVVAQNNLGAVAFERAWLLYEQDPIKAEAQFAKAEAQCRKVIEMKPDWSEAHNSLGNSIYERGGLVRKRIPEAARPLYREAETHYRKALEIDPKSASAERFLGRLFYTWTGYYRDYDVPDPDHPNQFELYLQAEKHYRRSLELQPNDSEALNELTGLLLWKATELRTLGRTGEVSKTIAEALQLARRHARQTGKPTYNLACALALTNNIDSAIATLEDLGRHGTRLNPDYLRKDTDLDVLRGHRRFQALLKKLDQQIS